MRTGAFALVGLVGLVVVTLLVRLSFAAKPLPSPVVQKPAAKPVAKPSPAARSAVAVGPLELLPSVARVKITSHGKTVSVVEEISLPRGDWKGEALDFYVAFGAPGPTAIDAHLLGIGDGLLEADDDDAGEALATERVPRRPVSAHPLLGRDAMAGIVVHVRADALQKAFGPGNMASLRIRSLVDVTEPDATGATSLVVRLGASRGTPLTLGRIVATVPPRTAPLVRVEARLCGPDADPQPLAVGMVPKTAGESAIAPVLAVRHASDDLCVRLWHARGSAL